VSNPVPPPGGAYPPPSGSGQPGFTPQPEGQPAPGAGYPPAGYPPAQSGPPAQEGQPFGPAGQPAGYPAPAPGQDPQAFGAFPAEEKKKSGAGKTILRIALAIVIVIIGVVVKSALFGGDDAKEAKAGDCIAAESDIPDDKTSRTSAKVVDCGKSEAAYTVVARVDGEKDPQSKSCDKFFKENEEFVILASDGGSGYLLCLRPKKA
jgi:hypothetical protein